MSSMSLRHVALAWVPLVLAAGCGDGDGYTATSERLPTCAEVWVAGQTLPADYEGCVGEDGVLEVSEIKKCSSSAGSLTTFDDTYFSLLGSEINDAGLSSPAYDALYRQCFPSGW